MAISTPNLLIQRPTRDLCIMACIFCREPLFHRWLQSIQPGDVSEDIAKQFIVISCQVKSRNDLDRDPAAAERFHNLIRKPYLAWKEQQ